MNAKLVIFEIVLALKVSVGTKTKAIENPIFGQFAIVLWPQILTLFWGPKKTPPPVYNWFPKKLNNYPYTTKSVVKIEKTTSKVNVQSNQVMAGVSKIQKL